MIHSNACVMVASDAIKLSVMGSNCFILTRQMAPKKSQAAPAQRC